MIFQTVATSNRIAVMARSMTTPSTSFSFWQHLCVSSFTDALRALADVPGVLGGSRKPSGSMHKPHHLALPARWEWSWGGGGSEWDANQLGINRGVTEQEGRKKKIKNKKSCMSDNLSRWFLTRHSEIRVFCFVFLNVKSTPSLSL